MFYASFPKIVMKYFILFDAIVNSCVKFHFWIVNWQCIEVLLIFVSDHEFCNFAELYWF